MRIIGMRLTMSFFFYSWSFGVLMWEVANLGGVPYPGVANHELLDLLLAGKRLDKPHNCSQGVWVHLLRCPKKVVDGNSCISPTKIGVVYFLF